MDQDKSSLSAPYGHACTNCVQSKCRCIVRRTGGPCERCHRINKECRPADTVRRRNPKKSEISKKSTNARLEEKLDGLVSLIKAGTQSSTITAAPQSISAATYSSSYEMELNNPAINQSEISSTLSTLNSHIPTLTPATINSPILSESLPLFNLCDLDDPSPAQRAEYLLNFRIYKSKYLPFVHIPSDTNVEQLQQGRPFLWLSIMAIGSKSISQQQKLSRKIRQTIAQEMVIQSERDIDLLLGLLIFIGWSHCQMNNKSYLALFTQLVISLVFDLGLNKPVPKETHTIFPPYSKPSAPRTMEERRVILGCFLVTSIISTFTKKTDALRWTPYMDECLQLLDEQKECPNDDTLVQQVRLQLIAENQQNLGISYKTTIEPAKHRDLAFLYLKDLHSQFEDMKTRFLTESSTNEVILLHLYSTELDIAYSPTFLQTDQLITQQRKSFKAALSWINVFLAITPAAYTSFPISILSQITRCLNTLCLLMTPKDPIWVEDGVFTMTNPLLILNRVIDQFEQAAVLNGVESQSNPEGNIFFRFAQLVRSFRADYEAKLGPDDSAHPTLENTNNFTCFPDSFGGESFDEDWLMDFVLFPSLPQP